MHSDECLGDLIYTVGLTSHLGRPSGLGVTQVLSTPPPAEPILLQL